jgi:NADH-quinone oxidoreductase subunit N
LAKRQPMLAFVNTVAMCSLAGVPLTAGFFGKLFIFSSAVERGMIWILVIAVLMSAVGFYYYFRVIIAMYMRPVNEEAGVIRNEVRISGLYKTILMLTAILTLMLGIMPEVFTRLF